MSIPVTSPELLWSKWVTFCGISVGTATEFLTSAQQKEVKLYLEPVSSLELVKFADVLMAYFSVPMHIDAVHNLDYNLFANPIVFSIQNSVPLKWLMEVFSTIGAVPYGRVWLPLLDVAHAANPSHIEPEPRRQYIQGQMSTVSNHIRSPMSDNTLESIFGGVMSSFPGLKDCISKILSGSNSDDPRALDGIIDQVQDVLIKPIIDGMGTEGVSLQPAISQILNGFRGLNSAFAEPKPNNTQQDVIM